MLLITDFVQIITNPVLKPGIGARERCFAFFLNQPSYWPLMYIFYFNICCSVGLWAQSQNWASGYKRLNYITSVKKTDVNIQGLRLGGGRKEGDVSYPVYFELYSVSTTSPI